MKINKSLLIVIFLFIIILINYVNLFQNKFAWDDEFFIVNNIHIRELKNIPGFFAEPSPGNLYRPLRIAFYAISYKIWHLNVFGYHLNSIILHFLVTILIFFITLKITDKTMFSFIASLFFASHPIHTDRVANMTASFDIYGILFMLLALFFYILFFKDNKNKKICYYIFSIAFYLLALFSSEEAITLILILLLYDFSFNYKINLKNLKLVLKKYIPYIAITIFYLIIRFMVLQQIGREKAYFYQSFFGTLMTTLKVFINYIILLFFPFNLAIEHSVKFETSLFSFSFLISLFALLLLFFFFIKSYKKSRLLFFSIGWFFITLLPFSNIFPQVSIMAERYLYLPSYGFSLFLTFLILKAEKINLIKKHYKIIVMILVILITGLYTFLTIQRNADWKDNFTLYNNDLKKNPFGTHINEGLALEYRKIGDYNNSIKHALMALQFSKENYKAYEILGTSFAYKKEHDKAILFYKKSIEINPDFYLAYNNLGLVYSYMNDFNNSIFYLKKAIEIAPELSKAHNDIATVYAKIGEFELAEAEFKKAIELNPYDKDYRKNLNLLYEFLEKE